MTDLEITRLCAEAMDLCEDEQTTRSISYREEGHIWVRHEADPIGYMYHPLHDDAQAMALVKKFGLQILPPEPASAGRWVVSYGELGKCGDNTNLNRAICECVVKMQQAKKP